MCVCVNLSVGSTGWDTSAAPALASTVLSSLTRGTFLNWSSVDSALVIEFHLPDDGPLTFSESIRKRVSHTVLPAESPSLLDCFTPCTLNLNEQSIYQNVIKALTTALWLHLYDLDFMYAKKNPCSSIYKLNKLCLSPYLFPDPELVTSPTTCHSTGLPNDCLQFNKPLRNKSLCWNYLNQRCSHFHLHVFCFGGKHEQSCMCTHFVQSYAK